MKVTSIHGLCYMHLHFFLYLLHNNSKLSRIRSNAKLNTPSQQGSQKPGATVSPQIACFNPSRCVTAPKSIQSSWNMGGDKGNMANSSSEIQKSGKICSMLWALYKSYEWQHPSERAELPHLQYATLWNPAWTIAMGRANNLLFYTQL